MAQEQITIACEVLEMLQHTLTTEQILEMRDKIFNLNSSYTTEINSLSHYVASLITEREETKTLRARPFVVKYDDDFYYTVLEECTEENKEEKMHEWQEKMPYSEIEIRYQF